MTSKQSVPDLPVEPLAADVWQRIERRVFAELHATQALEPRLRSAAVLDAVRAPHQRWITAAALALLLLTATSLMRAPQHHRYETSDRGQLVVSAGVQAQLEAHTVLTRAADAAGTWTLERGAALFRVAPREQGAPLTVLAGPVRIEVVGTIFRVVRHESRVSVETSEGAVRVIQNRVAQLVAAGERWPRLTNQTLEADQDPPAARDSVPTAAPFAGAASKESLFPAAGPALTHSTSVDRPARISKREAVAERQRRQFEEAALLEAHEGGAALQAYRRLARESGPWASNALFALARAEVEQNMHAEAERDLQRYLSRYPNGPNASDARALLAGLRGAPGWNHAP